jgi:RNA polymerase sigma factor (sigma-70 family)
VAGSAVRARTTVERPFSPSVGVPASMTRMPLAPMDLVGGAKKSPISTIFVALIRHQSMDEHSVTKNLNNETIGETLRQARTRLGNFIHQRVGNTSDAEDILQDVICAFVEACRLPEPIENASAWLFQVARRRIVDAWRKKREVLIDDESSIQLPDAWDEDEDCRLDLCLADGNDSPETAYLRSLSIAALQKALLDLPEKQREVFIAHEIEGTSFSEMAASSGVGINTLLARKRYAVLFLRERLREFYDGFDF